jgi:hypothetical protein
VAAHGDALAEAATADEANKALVEARERSKMERAATQRKLQVRDKGRQNLYAKRRLEVGGEGKRGRLRNRQPFLWH